MLVQIIFAGLLLSTDSKLNLHDDKLKVYWSENNPDKSQVVTVVGPLDENRGAGMI